MYSNLVLLLQPIYTEIYSKQDLQELVLWNSEKLIFKITVFKTHVKEIWKYSGRFWVRKSDLDQFLDQLLPCYDIRRSFSKEKTNENKK